MEYFKRYKSIAQGALDDMENEYLEILDKLTTAEKRIEELEEENEALKLENEDLKIESE
jgi:regulator of replication initiation timing